MDPDDQYRIPPLSRINLFELLMLIRNKCYSFCTRRARPARPPLLALGDQQFSVSESRMDETGWVF